MRISPASLWYRQFPSYATWPLIRWVDSDDDRLAGVARRRIEPDVVVGPQRRWVAPQRSEDTVGPIDVASSKSPGIDPLLSCEEKRACKVESLRDDDQSLLAEHLLRPQHRVERTHTSEVTIDPVCRHTARNQASAHGRGFVVVWWSFVAAHQQILRLSASPQGGSCVQTVL